MGMYRLVFEGERREAEMLARLAEKMGVKAWVLQEYGVGFP